MFTLGLRLVKLQELTYADTFVCHILAEHTANGQIGSENLCYFCHASGLLTKGQATSAAPHWGRVTTTEYAAFYRVSSSTSSSPAAFSTGVAGVAINVLTRYGGPWSCGVSEGQYFLTLWS